MAWRKLSAEYKPATRSLIDEFTTMKPAKSDRPLKARIVASIKHEIEAGQFRFPVWASAVCLEDGETYRVNGKHSSTVFSQMNGTLPKGMKCAVERYECDTLHDVAALYSTFDSRFSTRTQGDILRIVAGTDAEIEAIPNSVVTACVQGMAYAQDGTSYCKLTCLERADLCLTYKAFVQWANDVWVGGARESKHMRRAAVVAVMFISWQKHPKEAHKFWTLVRTGDGEPGCPTRKLERWLLTSSISIGRGSSVTEKAKVTSREMFVRSIHAWNAWKTNKKTELRYHADAAVPEVK